MSEQPADSSGSTTKSVSPKAIVPAVTVVGVFVLIILAAVVFMILRAYKRRRQRRGLRLPRGLDTENDAGVWREGDWDKHVRNGRLTRDSRQLQAERAEDFSEPPSAARRDAEPPWDAREIVGQGFQRGALVAANGAVNVRRGYEIGVAEERRLSVHAAEIALGVAPSVHSSHAPNVGKIERMTGNQLSNDLYSDRPSGHSREGRESLAATQLRIDTSMFASYKLGAEITSPATTVASWGFEISPNGTYTALAPAPAPAPAPSPSQLAASYPNVAALARVNVTVSSEPVSKRQSNRPAFFGREPCIAEHIASQFNSSRHKRVNEGSTARRSSSIKSLAPPLSAARGGFTGLRRYESKASSASQISQVSQESSISTFRHGTLEEKEEPPPPPPLPKSFILAPPPTKPKRSWTGRSVLLLDDAPPSARKKTLHPPAEHKPSSRRTSAAENFFGLIEHGGGASIQRNGSTSKASVSSMPSSISSLSTLQAGGLSPTPARRPPRTSRTTTATTTDDSDAMSSMTEEELQVEIQRIRQRARRASEERNARRRKAEDEDEYQQPARSSFGFL